MPAVSEWRLPVLSTLQEALEAQLMRSDVERMMKEEVVSSWSIASTYCLPLGLS